MRNRLSPVFRQSGGGTQGDHGAGDPLAVSGADGGAGDAVPVDSGVHRDQHRRLVRCAGGARGGQLCGGGRAVCDWGGRAMARARPFAPLGDHCGLSCGRVVGSGCAGAGARRADADLPLLWAGGGADRWHRSVTIGCTQAHAGPGGTARGAALADTTESAGVDAGGSALAFTHAGADGDPDGIFGST